MNVEDKKYFDTLENLSHADFSAQLNTTFRFYQEPNWIEGKLIEVTEPKKYPRQESFNLYFSLPKEFAPLQDNYFFEHESLDTTFLLLVPSENRENDYIFEAVFNRILKS